MKEEIAIRLKKYRKVNNITQERMAEDLHISRFKISNWETGRRDMCITDAIMVCNYLDISMDNLFNPRCLNSKEFCDIARRYFNNNRISLEEKNKVLIELYEYRNKNEISYLFNVPK